MLDYNNCEDPKTMTMEVKLAEDYDFTDESFGVFVHQQGNIMPTLRS